MGKSIPTFNGVFDKLINLKTKVDPTMSEDQVRKNFLENFPVAKPPVNTKDKQPKE